MQCTHNVRLYKCLLLLLRVRLDLRSTTNGFYQRVTILLMYKAILTQRLTHSNLPVRRNET